MIMQPNPIEAHERSVGQIFSDDYAFEIPPYQRPYAWEKDQTRELLSDLLDVTVGTRVEMAGPLPDDRTRDCHLLGVEIALSYPITDRASL